MNRVLILIIFLLVARIAVAQQKSSLSSYLSNTDTGIQDGNSKMVAIQTPKGKFHVWTKQVGNHPTIKLLLLNGGPGATHEYFECLENFLPQEGIEFIYYDQLGCGNSDNPKDTSMWDLDRFVEEVEGVRQALHLDNTNFYLLGHSWGGILAMQYALKYQNQLKGLIISNMMSSCPAYGKYAEEVLSKTMKPEILDTIRSLEARGDFDNPEYMNLLYPNFYAQHILRLPPAQWPEPVTRSFAHMNQSLYVTMQGPSEFGISGKLTNWDVSKRLPELTVPTLVVGAKYDTMDPDFMKWMSTQVKNGSYLYCAKGSHMSLYDDQATYMKGLIAFLKAVDKGQKKVTL